jgi:hypothetical protein
LGGGTGLSLCIYADESGDLGWAFDAPYGKKGSSRYLTIFAVCAEDAKCHHLNRVIRGLYKAARWNTKHERKWIDAGLKSRIHFAQEAAKLSEAHPDITYHAIVVNKQAVQPHLRQDPNKLYNYMLGLLLLKEMAKHKNVTFLPDNRSVKVASGNSLHDYLQTQLWYELGVETRLKTEATDSKQSITLQFADMMAGVVGSKFELGSGEPFQILAEHVSLKKLYFPH